MPASKAALVSSMVAEVEREGLGGGGGLEQEGARHQNRCREGSLRAMADLIEEVDGRHLEIPCCLLLDAFVRPERT